MSVTDGPFPWANFGESDGSSKPNRDVPLLPAPILPLLEPMAEPVMELDLTAEPEVPLQLSLTNDSIEFPDDFVVSVEDLALEMDSDQVFTADVISIASEQDWVTELPNLDYKPEIPAVAAPRLEEVIAQIDAEVAASAQVEDSTEVERRASAIQTQKHIMFSLAGAKYAMPLGQVIEISRAPKLMPLPNVPEWLLGVTNLRGDIISVVDLHAFLGLPYDTRCDASRMCVVRAEQHELVTGLMVDRVDGLASLASESFGGPSASLEGNLNQYLQGVGEHEEQLLRVLNLDSLLQAFDLSG